MTARETTHACPPEGEALTPCCERTPFELPRSDRMTLDDSLVTCGRGRETTLGALTAAGGCAWGGEGGPGCLIVAACGCCALDPDTPVTVYDEEET